MGNFGLNKSDYNKLVRPRYGKSNPELVDNPIWEKAIQEKWNIPSHETYSAYNDCTSKYREHPHGPVWSWNGRFGQSRTELADGRTVYIGGEFEDWYDPNFCIFNDIVVKHPGGQVQIYNYPKEVFPPTDFHTATIVNDDIILIGALGYTDLRKLQETQVLRLNTLTFEVERIQTYGEKPGWIHKHFAELNSSSILIGGGLIYRASEDEKEADCLNNPDLFELQLDSLSWTRTEYGDTRFFPVTLEEYATGRNPHYGQNNPQKSDNPFWKEMTERKWSSTRARLHYGDVPDEDGVNCNDKLPFNQVVWTAKREDTADVNLEDGRHLMIGGKCREYGEKWFDVWDYNDVIVTFPDQRLEIYTYPIDIFPPLHKSCALKIDNSIIIFGMVSGSYQPLALQAAAFELNPDTMAISLLDSCAAAINIRDVSLAIESNYLNFSLAKLSGEEPSKFRSFCLSTKRWV